MSQPSTDMSSGAGAIYLSQDDVELLLKEDSADARINVLTKIAANYSTQNFHERELQYAEQIFRLLMRDTELRVRQSLSEQVKDNPEIPRDIIFHMASDVEQVALPILQSSEVLSDSDLLKIVESSREMSRLIAISNRPRVSGRISHALVETQYPQVVKSLLKNDGAKIENRDFEQIMHDHQQEAAVISALVERAELPLPVAERLIHMVSDKVAEQLSERYKIDAKPIENQAREQVTLDMVSHNSSDEEIEATIDQMIAFDRLSPSIILSSLCRGYLRFFEIALAKLGNIPKANARKLIRDKGPLGFQAIYHKTELPDSMFEAVKVLLHAVLEMETLGEPAGTAHYTNAVVEKILHQTDGREIDNLPYIIALIRNSGNH